MVGANTAPHAVNASVPEAALANTDFQVLTHSSTLNNLLLFGLFAIPAGILAVLDHRDNWLPDCVTLPLAAAGLLVNMHTGLVSLESALIGFFAGYAAFRLLHDSQILLRGHSGIGLGDAKMMAALGAWLGWPTVPFLTVGGAVIMLSIYPHRTHKPFGTGLAATAIVALIAKLSIF